MKSGSPSLFLGGTPREARQYLLTVMTEAKAAGFKRIVIPCVGRFTGPLIAKAAGFAPEQIHASDVSLFSCLIGALIVGKDPRTLGAVVKYDELPDVMVTIANTTDPFEYAACLMFVLKSGAAPRRHAKDMMIADDLERRAAVHIQECCAGLHELVDALKGINYHPADLFDIIEEEKASPTTLLYIDPPGYTRGYEKMFDAGEKLTWTPPTYWPFIPKSDFPRLHTICDKAEALTITLRAADELGDDAKNVVWAMPKGKRVKYLMSNRPDYVKKLAHGPSLSLKKQKNTHPTFPVWGMPDDVIRADSVLRLQITDRDTGLYYRDLFAHALGQTDAECFLLLWLDGKVFGTVGLHLEKALIGQSYDKGDDRAFVWESYGFSSRSLHYPKHLNRLLMMSLTCRGFIEWLQHERNFQLGPPVGLRTACITKGHESKGNRGILKLLRREERPDGRFHLVYQTEWRPGTFADQVTAWYNKYGHAS